MAKKSSSKRMKKVQESDTGSEDDLFMEEDSEMLNYEGNEGEGYGFDDESDEAEQGEDDGDNDDDEGDEEGMNDAENEERNNAEIEELEKEYLGLRHEEQDLLNNLKRQKDEDLLKGQAVKNQKALWDKTLEFRFLLQKAFSSSNRLPQEPIRSSFCENDDETSVAYSDLITSSKKTLDSILELQETLLEKNPSITKGPDGTHGQNTKHSEASKNLNEEGDQEWLQISQMHSRMASFRDKSIDKWQRKTQLTTGAAAIKGKFQAFNQNVSDQVAAYMRDPSRMVKGMQQRRSTITIFGTVLDSSTNTKVEEADEDGDPELLDDSEFYQQLLKEFLRRLIHHHLSFNIFTLPTIFKSEELRSYILQISNYAHSHQVRGCLIMGIFLLYILIRDGLYALKRLQTKKRKIVDRRASKSRKIRYNVHEKIVNFMAPQPMDLPPMAPKLFENLFGLKKQKSTAVA